MLAWTTGAKTHGEVEVLGRACPMEAQFERIAALQYPTFGCRLTCIEHAREEPVEGHLASQSVQVNAVAPRPLEQARFESRAQRSGGGVLSWGVHRAPA